MPQTKKQRSMSMHRKVQISDTKSRKRLERPEKSETVKVAIETAVPIQEAKEATSQVAVKVDESKPVIVKFRTEPILEGALIQEKIVEIAPEAEKTTEKTVAPESVAVSKRIESIRKKASERTKPAPTPTRLTAKQIKEREIQKAFNAASSAGASAHKKRRRMRKYPATHFGFHRVVLALACATVAVLAIVYFVDSNSPDISLKVAAMQTGIDAVYPKYTPRGYALSDITSENGRVTLNFKSTDGAYSLVEENSTLDATTFFNDYVKSEFGDNYTKVDEQGITVYIGSRNAAWLSGGILYKLTINAGSLTRKQIVTIATTR